MEVYQKHIEQPEITLEELKSREHPFADVEHEIGIRFERMCADQRELERLGIYSAVNKFSIGSRMSGDVYLMRSESDQWDPHITDLLTLEKKKVAEGDGRDFCLGGSMKRESRGTITDKKRLQLSVHIAPEHLDTLFEEVNQSLKSTKIPFSLVSSPPRAMFLSKESEVLLLNENHDSLALYVDEDDFDEALDIINNVVGMYEQTAILPGHVIGSISIPRQNDERPFIYVRSNTLEYNEYFNKLLKVYGVASSKSADKENKQQDVSVREQIIDKELRRVGINPQNIAFEL